MYRVKDGFHAISTPMKPLFIPVLLSLVLLSGCREKTKNTTTENPPEPAPMEAAASRGTRPQVHPVAHATAVLEWEGTTVYIDPVGGASKFEAFPAADLILITDVHGDHFELETLQQLETAQAKIIVPQAVAELMPDTFTPQLDILDNGSEKERFGIRVRAIPMYNLREEALNFHEKGRGNGYVLEKAGVRVYFSGDTEDIPEMRNLENIEMAFVCMNLPYTMPVDKAAAAVLAFKPGQVYPYHYRGNPDVSDVSQFAELVSRENQDIEIVQLDWYPDAPY